MGHIETENKQSMEASFLRCESLRYYASYSATRTSRSLHHGYFSLLLQGRLWLGRILFLDCRPGTTAASPRNHWWLNLQHGSRSTLVLELLRFAYLLLADWSWTVVADAACGHFPALCPPLGRHLPTVPPVLALMPSGRGLVVPNPAHYSCSMTSSLDIFRRSPVAP